MRDIYASIKNIGNKNKNPLPLEEDPVFTEKAANSIRRLIF